MSAPRRPAAFRIEPEFARPQASEDPKPDAVRKPRALDSTNAVVMPAEIDVFDEDDLATENPPPATAPRRRSWLGRIFAGAFGILVSLAVGLWTDQLIRELFQRAEWLGWLAASMAALAALALAVILVREMLAISRLASVEKLRARALDAIARDDPKDRAGRGRRTVGFRRGQAGDGGRPPRAGQPGGRHHRRRQSGADRRNRDPRAARRTRQD